MGPELLWPPQPPTHKLRHGQSFYTHTSCRAGRCSTDLNRVMSKRPFVAENLLGFPELDLLKRWIHPSAVSVSCLPSYPYLLYLTPQHWKIPAAMYNCGSARHL